MRVWLQPTKLAAFRLTPARCRDRAARAECRAARRPLRIGRPEPDVARAARHSRTPADFGQLVVGRGADGYLVRLGRCRADRGRGGEPLSAVPPQRRAGRGPGHRPPIGRQHARGGRGGQGDDGGDPPRTARRHDHRRRIATIRCSSAKRSRSVWHTLAEAAVLVVAGDLPVPGLAGARRSSRR